MPTHISECSTIQDTVTVMKTAATNTETPKPLGNLSLFPREIRDEIYRHVCSSTYVAFYSSSIVRPITHDKPNYCSNTFSECDMCAEDHLSVLRLSKAINNEAMLILYSEGTFVFEYGLGHTNPSGLKIGYTRLRIDSDWSFYRLGQEYDSGAPQHPYANIIERMTNIELRYDATLCQGLDFEWDMSDYSDSFTSAPAGPLEFFQGVVVMRDTITVELKLSNWINSATKMMTSPWFRALKQLTGFRTVILGLVAEAEPCLPLLDPGREWLDNDETDKLYAGFEPLLHAMSKNLEPTLGNGSMSSCVSGGYEIPKFGTRYVVFHPRDHQAAILKAKNGTMNMEQSLPIN